MAPPSAASTWRLSRSNGGFVDSGGSFDDRPGDIACHESVDDLHPAAQLAFLAAS